MRVILFIEGGGEVGQPNGKDLAVGMRHAFNMFFRSAGIPENQFKIKRCGSRDQAYSLFTTAIKNALADVHPLLLVDSEDPIAPNVTPWSHLKSRDGWEKPAKALDIHVHLMVQCMENWFLADKQALANYFGKGFDSKPLPVTQPIEDALKADVLAGLSRASKETKKRAYSKGKHSFAILERLDPNKVAKEALWACRLLKTLDEILHLGEKGRERDCQVP